MPDFGAYFRKVFAEWTGQRERIPKLEATIRTQAETIARLKTELSDTKSEVYHQTRIAGGHLTYIRALERKFILPPPSGGLAVSEADLTQSLPLPLTTRDNSRAIVLSLSEWERFAAWAVPRVRGVRSYEPDVWDCGGQTAMLLGLAEEWAPGLACGWVELTSPIQHDLHKMLWLLATNGAVSLWYIDATPRNVVPWPEGVFSQAKNEDGTPWLLDRMGF